MWIKDKVNDCYKMSHSHLITIEKVNLCSVCQTTQEYETKYCPECGAKMDGDNNVK